MEADISTEDSIEWSVSGAMARQFADDSTAFLRSLAETLQTAFPGETVVRHNGLFGGDKRPIREVEITFTGEANSSTRLALADNGHGTLSASKTMIVRGIALKTASVPVTEWIEELGAMISQRSSLNKATRDALKSLL